MLMARQARKKSATGIYHVIFRGINKQVIFVDDEDRQKFLECLQYYKANGQYLVYGYCLMDNHIHLVIKETEEDISCSMKRLGVRFVSWYNRKYKRCGHLFQDRFKSESIENEEYLLTVLRYIHQNPLKAGLVKDLESFTYSSYGEYIKKGPIIERDFVLALFSSQPAEAVNAFKKFTLAASEIKCLDEYDSFLLSDEDVKKLIQKEAKVEIPTALQSMEKAERDGLLRKVKAVKGISTRQIARLTGISQSVISRA